MKKDPQVYLAHIRDSIALIREYTAGGEAEFFQDKKTQDAVIRNLEIIGEWWIALNERSRDYERV